MLAFDDNSERHSIEEEEENYFVSMTDMMVGILFIFIIMLMVFALQFQKQTDTSQDRIEEVAKKLEDLRRTVHEEIDSLNQSQRERTALLNDLKKELNAVGLEVQIDAENGVLRLTENAIRFDLNKSTLNPQASENVAKLAKVLAAVLPRYTNTNCHISVGTQLCIDTKTKATIDTVFIEGHSDTQGVDEINWQLSTQRAVATYRSITELEASLRQLKNRGQKEILSVSGYSSTRPIPGTEHVNDSQEQRLAALARNRRIDMRFVMEVDNSSGLNKVLELTDEMQGEIEKLRKEAGAK